MIPTHQDLLSGSRPELILEITESFEPANALVGKIDQLGSFRRDGQMDQR